MSRRIVEKNLNEHIRQESAAYRAIIHANSFAQLKIEQSRLEAIATDTGKALRALSGGGPMGLTPDSVRATPEWQAASKAYAQAFYALREFNMANVKKFAKDIRAERRARVRA